MSSEIWRFESGIKPEHLMQGLGAAERDVLCTSLALLDDSKLTARLAAVWKKFGERFKKSDLDTASAIEEISSAQSDWAESGFSDSELRAILWIRLREALSLPPRLSASRKGALALGDDVTAALISALDPPGLKKSGKRWLQERGWLEGKENAVSLQDIVVPVLDEFFEASLAQEGKEASPEDRRALLEGVLQHFTGLDAATEQPLLDGIKVNQANDKAALTILLTGAGLASFGTAVNLAGFSAYILAAQASAFIPLISGPGLVSFVSVLSNPITIIGGTAGVGYLATKNLKRQVGATVAARLTAILVLNGIRSERDNSRDVVDAFSQIKQLETDSVSGLKSKIIIAYKSEWDLVRADETRREKPIDDETSAAAQRPVADLIAKGNAAKQDELVNAMALAGLTVGELVYSTAAIDPSVLKAVDFAYSEDIGGKLDFAQLANQLFDAEGRSLEGAISRLEGYVAEQAVAAQLTASGHVVEFPGTSNNQGWDLMVDGQPFQVKFRQDISGIEEHFANYDYPVIANIELVDQIPDELAGRVFFVDGLGTDVISSLTETSLTAGDALVDPNIPAFAFLISASRGAINVHRGLATPLQALEQVVLDGTVRVGLATVGGVGGPVLGTMLFGPAGAWVFGVGAPIIAQSFTSKFTEPVAGWLPARKAWRARCEKKFKALDKVIRAALTVKQEVLKKKIRRCPSSEAGRYLRTRLWDDLRFLEEVERRLAGFGTEKIGQPEVALREYLRFVSLARLHPVTFQKQLDSVVGALKEKPGLTKEFQQFYKERMVNW